MIALGIIEVEPARREVLWQYLSAQPEFACVLCVGSHQEFLAGLKQLATKPRLVLANIQLPGCSGLTGLADLRQRLPEVTLFILSGPRQAECVVEALREGAAGYLEYLAPLPLLKQSLLVAAAGGLVIRPQVAQLLTHHLYPALLPALPADLTVREQQVLRGLSAGLSYQGIADQLCLSLDTVRTYVRQVYRKLGVNSRAGLLAKTLSYA
ncbi:LuxR C-terminal-related transcriptional regulator [Hymenobacter nivis]|uniref:DNA-binding response regulator n=1 Tax=Hymenobacter nivis TaxID=1850093 RepID=A0A502GUG3_9BACT|nr:response regulator transcription factor [Hymenobacter nivis]TPG64603.1 DNA-binding response regulator [Hymenobacter nivis]